ncbi:hypothetical protein D779_2370 [Imhoffiella purpurea]|uniref:Endonuclease/exonuclease/phosphatase domain-containing protein n=1 Tax=Imhoffiella purpurea TaxID=1249627 RepID=W9V4V4_9GAMM|nr:hypothetical protein D779_2370 [Imhoffiella purpurea]
MTLSVATYNIHRSMGVDRRIDDGRILDVILGLDADLVALQEVETPLKPEPEFVSLMQRLRHQGYRPVPGPTVSFERATYGNVLLSRLPIQGRRHVDLSYPGREPRALIDVSVEMKGADMKEPPADSVGCPLRCFATHLGLSAAERRCQLARISERLSRLERRAEGMHPTILLGDFNEWRRHPRRLAVIDAWLRPAPIPSTFPGCLPLLPLDRIWYGGGLRLERIEVIRTKLTRVASDHLPLKASLVYRGGSSL